MTVVALVILLHLAGCVAIERHNAMLSIQELIPRFERHVERLNREIGGLHHEQRQLVRHADALHGEIDTLVDRHRLDFSLAVLPVVECGDVIISVDFGVRNLRLSREELQPAALLSIASYMARDCANQVQRQFLAQVQPTCDPRQRAAYMSPDALARLGSARFRL